MPIKPSGRRTSVSIQSISLLLAACLLYSSIAPAYAEANIWEERKKALDHAEIEQKKAEQPWELAGKAELPALDQHKQYRGFEIPQDLGRIVESYTPEQGDANQPLVIHIQDAHGYV